MNRSTEQTNRPRTASCVPRSDSFPMNPEKRQSFLKYFQRLNKLVNIARQYLERFVSPSVSIFALTNAPVSMRAGLWQGKMRNLPTQLLIVIS